MSESCANYTKPEENLGGRRERERERERERGEGMTQSWSLISLSYGVAK